MIAAPHMSAADLKRGAVRQAARRRRERLRHIYATFAAEYVCDICNAVTTVIEPSTGALATRTTHAPTCPHKETPK